MENENTVLEEIAADTAEQTSEKDEPAVKDELAEKDGEIARLKAEVSYYRFRAALLLAGADPNRLDEGLRLAEGISLSDNNEPEQTAVTVLSEYPHLKRASRTIPYFAASSCGSDDGFAAIRRIFSGR